MSGRKGFAHTFAKAHIVKSADLAGTHNLLNSVASLVKLPWYNRIVNGLSFSLQVLSRDSVTVSVDAVVYYRVSNPTMATNNIEDYR